MTLSRATIPRPAIGSVTDAKASSTPPRDDPDVHPDVRVHGSAFTDVTIPTWRTSTHPRALASGGWTPKKIRSPGSTSFRSSTGSAKWCCSCARRGTNTGLMGASANAAWTNPSASKRDGPTVPPRLYLARSSRVRATWLSTKATMLGTCSSPRWPRYLRLARNACSSGSNADSSSPRTCTHPTHLSSRSSHSTHGFAHETRSSSS
mmetsp:Transcript_15030/g.58817  ORF Transcript_15030/g.58817 Transcript_15030/m.58817 type:complete len:206 (-) Transcript_15030:94-711(-)